MTSPNWDWAYSVIPTVAVSPSCLTHSWLSLNRIWLSSGIASPFLSFGTWSLVEREGNHLGRRRAPADLDSEPGSRLGQRGWDVGHPDVVPEREGDVARGHNSHRLTVAQHGIAMTRNIAIEHLQSHELPVEASLLCPRDGVPADEILVKAQRPFQSCLEGIGLVIHVVPVKPHSGFQPKRVAGAKARRTDAVGLSLLEQRPPEPGGIMVSAE